MVLRDRPRQLRPESEVAIAGLRLALAVATAAGGVLAIWVLGHLGFRLGAAASLGVPDLLAEPGQGLATGATMLMRSPQSIYLAALAEPLWIVLGFVAIALPASLLPLARPLVRGGPPASPAVLGLSAFGAALAALAGAGGVAWIASPVRSSWLTAMPATIAEAPEWVERLSIAAGIDLMLAIAMILWMIVALRLAIAPWLRWLTGSIVGAAVAIVLVGWAVSAATAANVHRPRLVVGTPGGEALLLGGTREHMVILRVAGAETALELRRPVDLQVRGRTSVARFIEPPAE